MSNNPEKREPLYIGRSPEPPSSPALESYYLDSLRLPPPLLVQSESNVLEKVPTVKQESQYFSASAPACVAPKSRSSLASLQAISQPEAAANSARAFQSSQSYHELFPVVNISASSSYQDSLLIAPPSPSPPLSSSAASQSFSSPAIPPPSPNQTSLRKSELAQLEATIRVKSPAPPLAPVPVCSHPNYRHADNIVSFTVTSEQAMEVFQSWANSLWMVPSAFHDDIKSATVHRCLEPFYSYNVSVYSEYQAQVAERSHKASTAFTSSVSQTSGLASGTVDTLFWSVVSGVRVFEYERVTVCALFKKKDRDMMENINDWDTSQLPFLESFSAADPSSTVMAASAAAPVALASASASSLSFSSDEDLPNKHIGDHWTNVWESDAHHIILRKEREACEQDIRAQKPFALIRDVCVSTQIGEIKHQMIYLPVYRIRYVHNDKQYTFLVNGQTCSFHGERPYGFPLSSISNFFGSSSLLGWIRH